MPLPTQRSFDELGTPLSEVPFCVLDLETTGGVASDLGITEVGAVRYVGGTPDGSFQTLVNPGMAIPPFITVLTGISHSMVVAAPPVSEMLPSLLEFIGDAVIVGHNVRYDLSFLNAAAEHLGYGRLPNRSVDTAGLARRLVRSEVRNLKLSTLAAYFRSPVTPNHRALEDAQATAHVLWALLERAGSIGVTHLDDLLTLPKARGSASFDKINLTEGLPRRPGVYFFKDRTGSIFYVGKAKDLRSRVRSYFYGDTRRRVAQMLRELDTIDHRVCATELEAEVSELRLIGAHSPRHNRRSKPVRSPHWVRLTREAFPRLSITRSVDEKALAHLGPFRGRRSAQRVVEAIWDATQVRRCTGPPGRRSAKCGFAQLGVAMCPCDGTLDEAQYSTVVAEIVRAIDSEPGLLLDQLEVRMRDHAAASRFEEAGWVRDRHRALVSALNRRRVWRSLQRAGSIWAEGPDGGAVIEGARLVLAWPPDGSPPLDASLSHASPIDYSVPLTVYDADEAMLIWKWLGGPEVELVDTAGSLDLPRHPVRSIERIAV